MTRSAALMRIPAAGAAVSSEWTPTARSEEPEAKHSDDAQMAQWLSFLGGHKVQAKLEVSSPGDADEREADAVADRVMRGYPQHVPISGAALQVSRKCAACNEDEQKVSRKATDRSPVDRPASANIDSVLNSTGRALDADTHGFMANRFGTDFADVRIHTGAEAARSAAAINARAYTVGRDIVFGAGQFDPRGEAGRHLLAHELTHVVQQRGSRAAIQREIEDDESGAEGGSEDDLFAVADEAEELDLDDANPATPEEPLEMGPGDLFAAAGGSKKKGKDSQENKKKASKTNACAGDCPQGKQKKITNNDCAESQAINKSRFISQLDVKIGAGEVKVTWSDGGTETWPCTANPKETIKYEKDVVGMKCSKEHTNAKPSKDGMSWFTAFKSTYKKIGFHDSQPVGPGRQSHGCVRVCCDKAELINKNSSSGVTKITVAK